MVGYSPWGCKESDTTERLHFHFLFFPSAWGAAYNRCLSERNDWSWWTSYTILPLVDSFYIFPETILPLEWKLKQSLDFSDHSWWPDIKHNTQMSKYNNNQIIIKTPNLILSWSDSSFSNLGLCKLQVESLWLRNGRVFSYFSKHFYSSCSIFLWRLGHAGGEKEEGALFTSVHSVWGAKCHQLGRCL